MATVVLAGLAAVGSAMIAAGTFAIGFSAAFGAFAIGAGLSLVSRALAPKLDLGTQMGGRSVMTREAAHSRKIVYGRARIGGNVVFLESSGTDNKYLYLVTAIAGHEIDAFEQVWFNDEKVWENNTFTTAWRTSTNASTSPYINFDFYKGDQTAADSGLVAASNKWTADHKLLDTAYMVVKLTYDQEKFAQGLPNISTVIRGKKVLDPTSIAADQIVSGKRYRIVTAGDTDFTSIGATANTVGTVFNATGTTSGSGTVFIIEWSQNPALCIYDYLRDTKYGLGETESNILTSSVTTARGVSNQSINLSGTGSQVRYTIDGVVDTANSIKSNIETMIGSMAGRLVYSGGKFEVHAGEYVAPSVTIDESMIIGEISVQTKQSRRNAYNGVKGVFVSEEDNYVVADYPAQISSTYATQDGDPIYLDMPLPYTINNVRAQRLAKLALLRSRQQEAITIPCNLTALKFKIGDNISVTNTRLGYSSKVFEVVGYSMAFSANQMVVNVEAIETASSIWDWSASDQEVFLGGGEVSIYDGTTAAAPTNLTVTGDSFVTADGAFNTAFNVAWTNADDAFTDHYIVEHKLTTASEYIAQQTNSSPFTIVGLRNSQQYNVRVKAVNEIGVSSAYVSATPTAATDTTAPSLPTSITATAGYKSISLAWTNPSEKDFNNVEIYRSTSSSGTYAEVSNVAGGFGAKAEHLDGGLADATAFYYKFKSVDLSGNKSAFSSVVNATTNAAAVDGQNGLSSFLASAYQRQGYAYDYQLITGSVTTTHDYESVTGSLEATFDYGALTGVVVPDTPSGGSFDFGNQSLTAPSGWSSIIPSGTNPLYISTAMASIQGITGTDSSLSWSTPELLAQSGTDGTDGTDGNQGAAGVRNAAGYVYYSLTSTNAPNVPTATAYNFTTGAFTNLNASGGDSGTWSRTPPVNTGGDAKYWAASYYITEATYNGTQSFDFGTVFNSVTFDGLVTFTNLNSALVNTGGSVTTINGGLITTDSLTVNKLSGDVTEVYPIGLWIYDELTTTETTVASWSLPTPSLSLSKRQRVSLIAVFRLTNSNNSAVSTNNIRFDIQKKSKGVNAQSIGAVTFVSFSNYQGLIYVSGNQLGIVDGSGGIADSATPSSSNNVLGVYYDATNDRTYINFGALNNPFTTGETAFYSDSKFTSAGTWVTPVAGFSYPVRVPSGTGSEICEKIPVDTFFGSTNTATDFRIRSSMTNNITSGQVFKIEYVRGTMENIA